MLYSMCDYLDEAMSEPLSVQQLAVGGVDVWVLGLVGFRISAELNVFALLENQGDRSLEIVFDFDLARPFGTLKPYRMMVDCLYPALCPANAPVCKQAQDEMLRDWLARCAQKLLLRDPEFRCLISKELPKAFSLPPDIHKVALALRAGAIGPTLSAHHLRRVVQNHESLSRAATENPQLLPLVGAYMATDAFESSGRDPVQAIKLALRNRGLSHSAWRYLCRYGARRLFKVTWSLTPHQSAFEVAVRYLLAMQAAGLPPPPPPLITKAWLQTFNVSLPFSEEIDLGENFHQQMDSRILGLAFKEANRRRRATNLSTFIQEFLGVCWWSKNLRTPLQKSQIHAGWLSLVGHWKADQAVEELFASTSSISWSPRLAEMLIGPWRVIPIANSEALIRESFAMRNCLRDLLVKCATGRMEIYSVRDTTTGKRLCCIGFWIEANGQSQLADVKGFANAKVPEELCRVACELAEQMALKSRHCF